MPKIIKESGAQCQYRVTNLLLGLETSCCHSGQLMCFSNLITIFLKISLETRKPVFWIYWGNYFMHHNFIGQSERQGEEYYTT